jgi:predicted anti-sigma-YlaC factor YlaD
MSVACLAVRVLLETLASRETSEHSAQLLRAHLGGCPDCRNLYAQALLQESGKRRLILRPPGNPVRGALRRLAGTSRRSLEGWGFVTAELLLVLVAGWYLSGVDGVLNLGGIVASEVAGWSGWLAGQADPPAPAGGDTFLLLISALLLAVTLVHLTRLCQRETATAT